MNIQRSILCVLVCILFLAGCGKKTDWRENFKENSKTPFGLYILYNESEELFDNSYVSLLDANLYDYLNNLYFEDDYKFSYVCIKNDARKVTETGLEKLLSFVEDGSTAFFSLNDFGYELEALLGFETTNLEPNFWFMSSSGVAHLKGLNGDLELKNEDFDGTSYSYDRNLRKNYFSSYDTNTTVVLGTQEIEGNDQPIFLKIYYGQGVVYVHTQPSVFTNYNLLNDNYEYAERVLSYVPSEEILWDPHVEWSYQDQGREDEDSDSVFNFFLRNPPLEWFLYLVFIGLITFLLFNARRRQRPIPIIDPPKNSTLEFTHTISNMYLLNEDHKNMVDKKIQYFLEKVRSRYYLDTSNLNREFIEKLASKSGNDLIETERLVRYILILNKKYSCQPNELMNLNKMIDNFFKKK